MPVKENLYATQQHQGAVKKENPLSELLISFPREIMNIQWFLFKQTKKLF